MISGGRTRETNALSRAAALASRRVSGKWRNVFNTDSGAVKRLRSALGGRGSTLADFEEADDEDSEDFLK